VRLTGRLPRQEFLALLADTDVIVLPSVWPENEPVSLLEAVASGTAQIATDLGGSAALVEHGRSGYLIAPGDPDALAEAMLRYIHAPSLAAAHGEHNRQRRELFDESRTISRLEALLDEPASADDGAMVVVCGAASLPPQAEALVRALHAHLQPGPVPRLLWHDWCGVEAWADARLLWLWDRHAHEALFAQALKRGIPVLAPRTDWAEGLARHYGGVVLYRTYLEAMAALRALLVMPDLRRQFADRAYGAADAAVAMAQRGAFDLRAEQAA
jgi:glycosyltransferase involved in cell wall biosynthesis